MPSTLKILITGKTDSQDFRVKTETSGHLTEDGNRGGVLRTKYVQKKGQLQSSQIQAGRPNPRVHLGQSAPVGFPPAQPSPSAALTAKESKVIRGLKL